MLRYIEFTEYTENDEEIIHRLPAKREVCSRCDGDGHHSNPAIDGHGIGMDEWNNEWDEEEREMYLSGAYDITCEECHGEKIVEVLDYEAAKAEYPELLKKYQDLQNEKADYEAMCAAERRMGA